MARAITSSDEPAGATTTQRMGLLGKLWAQPLSEARPTVQPMIRRARGRERVCVCCVCGMGCVWLWVLSGGFVGRRGERVGVKLVAG